jgi:hypothetical protein
MKDGEKGDREKNLGKRKVQDKMQGKDKKP